MLGNAIKQTTATTGAGNLTLAAVAGFTKFSDNPLLLAGAPFGYGLVDANGNEEWGIGRLIDANTVARALICQTFVTGVLNTVNPTPISLSGSASIIGTPHAAMLESMLPNVDTVSSNVRRILTSAAKCGSTTAAGSSANNAQYTPFLLRTAARIDSLGMNVTVGAGLARLGLYACSEKGYIGPQLASTGDVDTSASGFKQTNLAAPISLPPGWYFTGAIISSGSLRATAYNSNSSNIMGGSPLGYDMSMAPIEFRTEAVGALVLPTAPSVTTSAVTVGSSHPIIVYLGAAP